MTGTLLKKKLMLEDYISFINDPDLTKLSMDQIHEIVTLHGYVRPKLKSLSIEGLKSIELQDPTRSTIGDSSSVYPCAPLDLEEVKNDIRALGWEECPIGSILAVGSSADAEEKERKRKMTTLLKPPPVMEAEPISASSAMTSPVVEKRSRRKKKKVLPATPMPSAMGSSEKKKMSKKKARKMKSISKALVVV